MIIGRASETARRASRGSFSADDDLLEFHPARGGRHNQDGPPCLHDEIIGIQRRVNPYVLDLFASLLARADGKLGPGEPKLLMKTKR